MKTIPVTFKKMSFSPVAGVTLFLMTYLLNIYRTVVSQFTSFFIPLTRASSNQTQLTWSQPLHSCHSPLVVSTPLTCGDYLCLLLLPHFTLCRVLGNSSCFMFIVWGISFACLPCADLLVLLLFLLTFLLSALWLLIIPAHPDMYRPIYCTAGSWINGYFSSINVHSRFTQFNGVKILWAWGPGLSNTDLQTVQLLPYHHHLNCFHNNQR